jgi:hypothetical protein
VLAVEWGNSQAYAWRSDESFWRGLALGWAARDLSMPPGVGKFTGTGFEKRFQEMISNC